MPHKRQTVTAIGALGAAARLVDGGALSQAATCSAAEQCAASSRQKENLLLQLNHNSASQIGLATVERVPGCRAAHTSVSDEACSTACDILPKGVWPCDESGVCTCEAGATTTSTTTTRSTTQAPVTTAAPAPAPTQCRAVAAVGSVVDDTDCARACQQIPSGVWPCDESGVCTCEGVPSPTAAPSTTTMTTVSTTMVPTTATTASTTRTSTTMQTVSTTQTPTPPATPAPSAGPVDDATLSKLISSLQTSDSSGVFMYDTGNGWLPSDIYTWPDMIKAVQIMATKGVGKAKLWSGFDGNHVYGLVNLAAFLAQCMQETIQYNACDENNWSDNAVVKDHGGSSYSATSACGQLHQSYQDYTCSAEEDDMAGGQMACDVDPDMEMRASTQAGWYGAPAKLFCAPKSKVPKAPRWDYSTPWCAPEGGWGHVSPFSDDVPLDDYFTYVNNGGSCKDYEGIKTGGWTFSGAGCVDGACPGSDAPLFGKPDGRTDVEGCCWWGRGVIQTTGVCNFGKLNFYLGKRAANEGRDAAYPDVDFCRNPGAICEPDGHPELKWVAGLFYWLNSVQPYTSGSWNYQQELKNWVDSGRKRGDTSFINGASGIVNRGCHNPPNCGTGELHGGAARIQNFHKVLDAMGL